MMLNNWINRHDFAFLCRHSAELPSIVRRVLRGRIGRVSATWSQKKPTPCWSNILRLRQRWNRLASGDENSDHIDYFHRKYLHGRDGLTGLALGCGDGSAVLRWLEKGGFSHIRGLDITPSQIAIASESARRNGCERMADFVAADVNSLDLPPGSLDCIFADHALHHFARLDRLVAQINVWLKPDGLLLLSEYVGPRRFQWTPRQMEAGTALLKMLPSRLRVWHEGNRVKHSLERPSKLRMFLGDPSEAIESDRIMPSLHRFLAPIEIRPCANTLLHPLLHGIAHHFSEEDPEAAHFLEILIQAEDRLLECRDIESDFLVAAFGKGR
jgi:SAM-dependent methyltransferase